MLTQTDLEPNALYRVYSVFFVLPFNAIYCFFIESHYVVYARPSMASKLLDLDCVRDVSRLSHAPFRSLEKCELDVGNILHYNQHRLKHRTNAL